MKMNDRFKQAREAAGLTQEELGVKVGVSQVAVLKIESGKTQKPRDINNFARALGVDVDWLLTGEIQTKPTNEKRESNATYAGTIDPWDSKTPLNEDDVEVPFYTEVELSAGSGSIVQKQNKGPKLRFSKSTLKRQGVEIDNAACVSVRGNSMEPVIPDGACVGIDTSKTEIKDGDMYAIDWHGELYVKTLTRKPGGGLRIRSFNIDEYPDENLNKDDTKHVKVIGRVFWYSVLR
jgi:phage repressor protein C with HTH and peptisase S24 domain